MMRLTCSKCRGRGKISGLGGIMQKCKKCDGVGWTEVSPEPDKIVEAPAVAGSTVSHDELFKHQDDPVISSDDVTISSASAAHISHITTVTPNAPAAAPVNFSEPVTVDKLFAQAQARKRGRPHKVD